MKRMRRHTAPPNDRAPVSQLLVPNDLPDAQVMDNVLRTYYLLPDRFRSHSVPQSGDRSQDLFTFQAANIQTTLQLVRMTLFSTNLVRDVDQKCHVAEQVLNNFNSISLPFLRAISTPLVYHLGRIGRILATVMEGILGEQSYQRVRGLLVSMADLLQGLESGLHPTAGASRDLRAQIQKIDQHMDSQRQIFASGPVQQPRALATKATNGMTNGTAHGTTNGLAHSATNGLANGAADAMMSGVTSATNGLDVMMDHSPMNGDESTTSGLGHPVQLDEFQLPPDLVGSEVWPWPFDLGPEAHMPTVRISRQTSSSALSAASTDSCPCHF